MSLARKTMGTDHKKSNFDKKDKQKVSDVRECVQIKYTYFLSSRLPAWYLALLATGVFLVPI